MTAGGESTANDREPEPVLRQASGGASGASDTPSGPRPKRVNPRVLVMAGIVVGVVAIASAIALALSPGGGEPSRPVTVRLCPWHYVVTDGVPAAVLITDSAGPDREGVGVYEPGQVFYAAEPPAVSHGMLKTVDGWVAVGGWIQRYGSSCVTVPAASVTSQL